MVKRSDRGKLSKGTVGVIAVCIMAALFLCAVLITNAFIPVKYFTSYCVKGNGNTQGTLRVSFIDVDFGDCILLELPDGKTALIDGGDGAYPNENRILRFLNSRNVKTVDYLICSSVKKEHCGGLAEIIKYKNVKYAYIPYCRNERITKEYHAFTSALKKSKIEYSYACAGGNIVGENYYLAFLSPADYRNPLGAYAKLNDDPTAANIDNASAVIWLQYGSTSFVFTSDIRAEGLKQIMSDYEIACKLDEDYCAAGGFSVKLELCDIVSVPAHGGADNTYAPWYDLIQPECAVVSVGKNFAGLPSKEAVSDASAYCSPYFTSESGDITITVGDGYTVTTAR